MSNQMTKGLTLCKNIILPWTAGTRMQEQFQPDECVGIEMLVLAWKIIPCRYKYGFNEFFFILVWSWKFF